MAETFDPDAYLASKSKQQEFDPDAYLATKAPTEQKGFLRSLGDTAMEGLGSLGKKLDSYTGAPMRAGIFAAQEGKNPLSAAYQQFGDSDSSPSGKDIVMRAGVTDVPVKSRGIQPKFVEEEERRALGPAYDKYKENAAKVSPADIAGFGMDMAADPTLMLQGAGKAIPAVGKALAEGFEMGGRGLRKGVALTSHITSGAPTEAVERLIQRPSQVLKPPSAIKAGEAAREELLAKTSQEGKKIGDARKAFRQSFGESSVDTSPVVENLQENIANKGTIGGEQGALSPKEEESLKGLIGSRLQTDALSKKPAGSLQHFADYLKNQIDTFEQSRLPGGNDTAYQSQLRKTYGQVKGLLHDIDPNGLKQADKQFHEFAKKADKLGQLENPDTMERFVSTYYGPNKSTMREAAEGLIPNSLEDIKDIGAAKSFNTIGPSGSHAGLRNITSAGLIGKGMFTHDPLSVVGGLMMQPSVQKQLIGRGAQLSPYIANNPEFIPLARGALVNQYRKKK